MVRAYYFDDLSLNPSLVNCIFFFNKFLDSIWSADFSSEKEKQIDRYIGMYYIEMSYLQ